MKKWLIIYSSVTGNTKYIAEAMAEAFEPGTVDICTTADKPDFDAYEVIMAGYWLTKGGPSPDMQRVLSSLDNKMVIFFQTHGAEVGSEHAVTAFARAANYLGSNNYILGTFSCQGRINPKLLARRRNADPNDPHSATERNKQRWLSAAEHPNEDDRVRAGEFVAKMKHKLELRNKYLAKQNNK